MQPVRVITGLGNPGVQYDGTRHNIGFQVLDQFASGMQASWSPNKRFDAHTAETVLFGKPLMLIKPQTFMNLSGLSVQKVCRYYRFHPSQVLIVYDEIQIPLGQVKVSLRGSAGGHNGIEDILSRMGGDFIRYRIGIGPAEKSALPLKDFVLGKFSENEKEIMNARLPHLVEGLKLIIRQGPERAMNQLNQRTHIE